MENQKQYPMTQEGYEKLEQELEESAMLQIRSYQESTNNRKNNK